MWQLKLIGSMFVIMGCYAAGLERIEHMKKRLHILREMSHSLYLFKGFAETYRLPLEWICEKVSQQVDAPISNFYQTLEQEFKKKEKTNSEEIWRNCIKHMGKAFDKEDRMLFLRLGDFVGVQDVRIQSEVIENCLEQVKERCEILEKERPEKEHLYRVLSFSISGFLILLFI